MEAANITGPPEQYEWEIGVDRYMTLAIYAIGFPGNILAFIVWMQKRMRHSSGCYLAALALDNLVFLAAHIILELYSAYSVNMLNYPVVCQTYPAIFLAVQYLSPYLVLAFTTERYISICHPFKRERYCTIRRAKIVIACLITVSFVLCSPHAYFYHLRSNIKNETVCEVRDAVMVGGTTSVFQVYNSSVETMSFFVVPVAVLILNILVICEMRRLSRVEQTQVYGSGPQRTASTTVMLLAVSFYQIITTMPISVTYILYFQFHFNEANIESYGLERASHRFKVYRSVLTIIKEYGLTHYAFNFFIYVVTGKMFRQELKRLFLQPFAKVFSSIHRGYSSLRTSVRNVEKTKGTSFVTINGGSATVVAGRETNETLL